METEVAGSGVLAMPAEFLSGVGRDALSLVFGPIPQGAESLFLLPLACIVLFALFACHLGRQLRRTRAALGGLLAEVERLSRSDAVQERSCAKLQSNLGRLIGDTAELQRRQRSLELRLGKPDSKLAAAMTRAGTKSQHMVDCGLSHGEIHLLQALNAGGAARASAGPSPE